MEPGTLFVVATPIGNLEDITLRALRVLREVAVVAAEDTRRTGNLLRHYRIDTPLLSLHEHNEHQRLAQLVGRLQRGESIALVSDAGTPGISDPGALLVRAARDAGIRVDPVPGASAVTALLSASGLIFDRFAFAGFPPVRSKDRKAWFQWVKSLPDTPIVCFEAPHRIESTLRQLRSELVNRPIIVARELTKAHEEWVFLPPDAADLKAHDAGGLIEKGEFAIVLGPITETTTPSRVDDSQVALVFGHLANAGAPSSRREAIRAVAEQLRISPKAVYDALERAKKQPA